MKYMKYSLTLGLLFTVLLMLSGCQSINKQNDGKIQVITTIFPIYDFTKEIAQDKVDVTLILPPGVEPHSYAPKPRDIFEIRNSALFIYTGDFLEVWAHSIISVLDEDKVDIIKASDGVHLLTSADETGSKSSPTAYDPHIWLDPNNAIIMVNNILNGLIKVDPENQSFYENNAAIYIQKLQDLDNTYNDLFSHTKYTTIIFGGHYVLGYLAYHYHLNYKSPYNGFSPDALPTPKKMQELINLINTTGEKTIFYEELVNPKVAQMISENTGAEMLAINGAGNVSKNDFNNHVSYLTIMYENIENLKKGLEYHE